MKVRWGCVALAKVDWHCSIWEIGAWVCAAEGEPVVDIQMLASGP